MNIFLILSIFLLPIFLLLKRRGKRSSHNIPPGSLGLPIIGQSLGLLRAMKANTAEKWLEERARKYGPISKLSLFGKPTVFIYGQAANKFVFTSDSSTLTNQQPQSIKMILGDRSLLELGGEDHKRVRDARVLLKARVFKAVCREDRWRGQEPPSIALGREAESYCKCWLGFVNLNQVNALIIFCYYVIITILWS